MTCAGHMGESHVSADRKPVYAQKNKELVTLVPRCGEDCTWRKNLITSSGIWSIRHVLELSLVEIRPELWGKYTYDLNRLQGIITS